MNNNENQLTTNESVQNDKFIVTAGKYVGNTVWNELVEPVLHSLLRKLKNMILERIEPTSV